jgi:NodT family efflux transporter outer membrane factor (OMF) lipoprotein
MKLSGNASMRASPLPILAGTLMAGCRAVGPDYVRPEFKTPQNYVGTQAMAGAEATTRAVADQAHAAHLAEWWKGLNDPTLASLVERAIQNNLDLRVAASRVREALALRGAAKAGLAPTVDLNGAADRSRSSEETEFAFGADKESTRFRLGAGAAWELDLFGAVRRGIESADADLQAAVEGGREVLVSLVAEVATAYVDLRSFQTQQEVVRGAIRAQGETVSLLNSRLQAGLSNELELQQAKAQLALREARFPALKVGERRSIFRLSVLLGVAPDALLEELQKPSGLPQPPGVLPVGAPSDLLLRRPDLRRAERQLAAATARIGVATADLYPRVSLNGSFAFEAADPPNLFNMNSRAWSIGPEVRWNAFDAGRIRRQIEAEGEREKSLLYTYEQTLLLAMEEVESAMVGLSEEQVRRVHLNNAVTANQRVVQLASDRYTGGIGEFLDVLDGQRTLYDAQEELVRSDATVTQGFIALYRSLGGGWPSHPQPVVSAVPSSTPPPAP